MDQDIDSLEERYRALGRETMATIDLKRDVDKAEEHAQRTGAPNEIVSRIDLLQIKLTERLRDNVCKNTQCPHYGKKCKMR
jgi:hypothetical protein